MPNQRFWEIILEFGYVYADDEDAAWSEANRLLHDNGSVDFTLKEKTNAECDLERAASDLLAACEALIRSIDDQHMAPVCSAEEAAARLDGPYRSRDYLLCDHACAECVPGGEAIKPGFRCGYHAARAAIAKAKGEVRRA